MNIPVQLSVVSFKQNAYIFVEGERKADCFFIIQQGKVRISKEVEIAEEEGGSILSSGDFFGVVATMSGHRHIETAQALTDVSLISVHKDQYGLLIVRNAPVAMKIIQQFSRKMRYLDETLTQITLKGPVGAQDVSHLFTVAEYYARDGRYNQAFYAYYQYALNCPGGEHIAAAKERMAKIKPYARAVYLESSEETFTRSYPKETMVFAEAQPGKDLFVIQKGSIKITKIVNNNEVLLAVLKAGDIFGEMALLENKLRSASAIVHEDAVLMTVNQANFARMVSTQPQIISRLTQLLSERLWTLHRQLANTQITDLLGRLYDALSIQVEKQGGEFVSEAHTFDFGPAELVKMVGLPQSEGAMIVRKLLENNKIRIEENRIHVTDKREIESQMKYHKKMEKIARARKISAFKGHR